MPNTITLSKSSTGWNATFAGSKARDIIDLFGTATIPTAFTSAARKEDVIAEVSKRNPGYRVIAI